MILYNVNFCECMCWTEIKEGKRFVNHHAKGHKLSEENRKKISEATKLAMNNNEVKEKISKALKGRIPANLSILHSREVRDKIGKSLLGRCHTKEHNEKISEALIGREFSDGHKKHLSEAMIGKVLSEEHKQKLSKSHKGKPSPMKGKKGKMVGENNPNWKGGTTPEYVKVRCSIEYKDWLKAIYKRDGYLCHRCNCGGKLVAHHIMNFAKLCRENQFLYDVNNGITFCRDCHEQFHRKYGKKNNNQQQIFEFIYLQSYGI